MRVTLWRHDVRLRDAPSAAGQRHDERIRLFVRVEHGGVDGFGEVAPQPVPINADPGVDDVIAEVLERVVPQVQRAVDAEGDLPSWTRVGRFAGPRAPSNPAVALIEMAVLERELQRSKESITSLWPVRFETPSQRGVSLLDPQPWTIDARAARIRIKTAPGALDAHGIHRLDALDRPLLLDFNCSARTDEDVIEQVRMLSGVCDVVAVEQPFAVGNVADTARLAARMDVAISVDEGIRSIRDVTQLVRYGAARMVCVKPARVGGLANARTIVDTARSLGLAAYIGGFFESPYARAVHRHLACATTSEPSDVAEVAIESGRPEEVETCSYAFGLRPSLAMLDGATVVATVS